MPNTRGIQLRLCRNACLFHNIRLRLLVISLANHANREKTESRAQLTQFHVDGSDPCPFKSIGL
eukprot:scaffold1374_cov175-Amphora_coffeaeformis.AAC.6